MHSGTSWRLGHRPALDGVRGIAILLVLACHLLQWWWPTALGSVGVTVFFTLSGFLITALLLQEATARRVSLGAFYRRRALRQFPALAVMVAVVGPFIVVVGLARPSLIAWVLTYGGNWFAAAGGHTSLFGHTWSLAIEEQFYIVWPVVLLTARRWRHGPLIVASVGIVAAVVLRVVLWDGGAGEMRVYFGSDTRADSLLVGCALAIALHSGVRFHVSRAFAVATGALTLGLLLALSGSDWANVVFAATLVPWVTAVLVVHALSSPGWLTGPVLRWFGERSYGIYLWNWPIIFFATGRGPAAMVAATIVGLGVAELSWRFVEQPIRRRRAAEPVAGTKVAPVPAYGV